MFPSMLCVQKRLILALAVIDLTILCGCSSRTLTPEPIKSPDGKLVLVTSVNTSKADMTKYLCVKFEIRDSSGAVLYQEQTGASTRMKWRMYWDGNRRVVLESFDIGTYAWEQQPDGKWRSVAK